MTCDPQDLRPHPSYARHNLAVSVDKLSALRARGELAFLEHVLITSHRVIIDGYDLWELAKELKRQRLQCIEYDLSETEALEWLLQRHRRSAGLNNYSRIMLALDLEAALSEKARVNQKIGGQQKGWSNLTKAEVMHVRHEIAQAASVSTGNVSKVKQLNSTCVPEIIAALYDGEISIHWAWKLRNELPENQLDVLGRFRFEKGLMKDIRKLSVLRQRTCRKAPQDASDLLMDLTKLHRERLQAFPVEVINGARAEIFITNELARIIGMEQPKLWKQGAVYNNLPKAPETCGTDPESVPQSATI